jgi:hypothetical protein
MTDRDKNSAPDHDRDEGSGANDDSIIPGKHGKHGGGMESEGAPQEPSREQNEPSTRNGDDRNRH